MLFDIDILILISFVPSTIPNTDYMNINSKMYQFFSEIGVNQSHDQNSSVFLDQNVNQN